jgi:hypothetical protein
MVECWLLGRLFEPPCKEPLCEFARELWREGRGGMPLLNDAAAQSEHDSRAEALLQKNQFIEHRFRREDICRRHCNFIMTCLFSPRGVVMQCCGVM